MVGSTAIINALPLDLIAVDIARDVLLEHYICVTHEAWNIIKSQLI